MPHQIRESKKYIVVFCEGESEQVYMDFLKKEFRDVAVIVNGKLYLSHLGKKGNEYLSHPTKPL